MRSTSFLGSQRFRGMLKGTGILVTATAGVLLFLLLFGTASFKVYDLSWKIFAFPSLHGQTVIELPPFGTLSARTHQGPMELHLRLEQVGASLVQSDLLEKTSQSTFVQELETNIPHVLLYFSLRQVMAAFLGGALLVLLVWRPRMRIVLGSGLGGAVLVSVLLATGIGTYRTSAFQEPQYDGVIAQAPYFIRLVNESLPRLGEIRDQTGILVDHVQTLVSSTNTNTNLQNLNKQGNVKKILLVGDLHSNPVGVELIKSLVRSFDIDFIIDAGDLTDFGTPLETKMAESINNLGVPYLFCPGNHETDEMIRFMKKLDHVVVLEGHTVTIQGVKIFGSPDPLSSSPEVEIKIPEVWAKTVKEAAGQIKDTLKKEGIPDILVVHNPEIGRKLAGSAPLIVSGHTHRQTQEDLSHGSVLLNPGTTGAAGLRGLYSQNSIPYSAIILQYSPGQGPLAADFIQYDLLSQHFSLERHMEASGASRDLSVTASSKAQPAKK